MFVMFDSVNVQEIPSLANTNRDAVAGYVDGLFRNEQEVIAHDPQAHHLSIAVFATDVADCLDIENGDATPEQAPAWWHHATMHGIWRPCLYASLSVIPDVVHHLEAAGIHRSSYRLWSAHYTGQPHVEPGTDATQWTDRALGRNLDESLCLDTFFPSHPRAKKSPPHRVDVALLEYEPDTGHWTVSPRPARSA